jgi:16S rRNA processing protein RimM
MKLQFVKAGEIVTTHGVRGEVKVLCWLDDPEMLCEFDRCRIGGKEYIMDQVRVQKTCNLVKLQGVDTMEAAQALRGKIIELYREDIDDEVIFADELKGVEVFADGNCIGKIVDGLDYPGGNGKNCSYGFDRFGHGCALSVGPEITAAWAGEDCDPHSFVELAVQAADRIRNNMTRYVTIL